MAQITSRGFRSSAPASYYLACVNLEMSVSAACLPVRPTQSSYQLVCHPADIDREVHSIAVDVEVASSADLRLVYRVSGDVGSLRIPDRAKPGKRDGLWRHTCFELFLGGDGAGYCEFNFSPSLQWAAYRFGSYRGGETDLNLEFAPRIHVETSNNGLTLEAYVRAQVLRESNAVGGQRMVLAAVIEHRDNYLSHWALVHPAAKADFHHPDGFVGVLPDNVA